MNSKSPLPKIAVSCGDLNGIGMEVFIRSVPHFHDRVKFLLFLPSGMDSAFEGILSRLIALGQVEIIPVQGNSGFKVEPGLFSEEAGKIALASFTNAVLYCKENPGTGLLTLPINKKSFVSAGSPYSGHTELLGNLLGEAEPLMILMNNYMKVALLTVHIPVASVSALITRERIRDRFLRLNESLKHDFGIKNPSIAILSLNPHAGDGGTIGQEELTVYEPEIASLNKDGFKASGPFASDGFFGAGLHKKFDGILASYHDQGLIPVKLSGMDSGVNFSAGSSLVRTSPDHGTAYDIAGKGLANPSSTIQAIEWNLKIQHHRKVAH